MGSVLQPTRQTYIVVDKNDTLSPTRENEIQRIINILEAIQDQIENKDIFAIIKIGGGVP